MEYNAHLQDNSKLASHLQPLINQFSAMNQSLQAMTNAYQEVINKMSVLEAKSDILERKNEILYQENIRLQQTVKSLTARVEANENICNKVELSEIENAVCSNNINIAALEERHERLYSEVTAGKNTTYELRQNVIKIQESLLMHSTSCELVPRNSSDPMDYIREVEEKTLEVERTLNILSVHHSELELQLQASLASTHNGAFLWRIPEMRRRIRDAKIGRITSIYSPPFYTGRNGYKMCIRAYLNGDGSGEGTHLSIFFVIMKGEYDPLLQWPFDHKVSLVLVDQDHKKHLVQTFKPSSETLHSSFQRPQSNMNVASGCPEFATLSVLDDPSYVKDDVMYIKAIVDTSKIMHP